MEKNRQITAGKPAENFYIKTRPNIIAFDLPGEQDADIAEKQALNEMWLQNLLVCFFMFIFVASVASTFTIFFLHGFKVKGFQLPVSLLNWLGGATIGQIAGLGLIIYKSLFPSSPISKE